MQDAAAGREGAADRLYTKLYPELKRLARSHLDSSGPITLDPSTLIHEVWLRSRAQDVPEHRGHFFALASRVMRSVIVDHVRASAADKRAHGVVEMRFFGGLLLEEIAQVLNVSVPTVKRDWRRARAFLFEQLAG